MPQFDETSKKLPSSDKDREELNSLNLDSRLLNSVENIDIIFLDPSQIPSWNSKANEISFGHQNCYENMVSPSVRFGKSSEHNEGMSAPEIPNISDFDSCSIFKDYTGSDNRQKVYINVGDRYKGERAWEKIYQLSNHLEKCNREEIISFITRIKKNQNMGGCKSSTCSRNGLSGFERSTINDRVSSSVSKSSIVYP